MTQTGTGTLSMSDVELLRTGYQALFNRADISNQGLLIVVDFAQVQANQFDSSANVRLMMYLATVLTDPLTQTDGVTVVYVVRDSGMPPVDTNPEGYRMAHAALPLKMKQMIVARAFRPGKESILNFLTYQTARVNEYRSGMQPQQVMANSVQETLQMLQDKGVSEQHLPDCLGGRYTKDSFSDWIRMRLSLEDIMAPAPVKINFITPATLKVQAVRALPSSRTTIVTTSGMTTTVTTSRSSSIGPIGTTTTTSRNEQRAPPKKKRAKLEPKKKKDPAKRKKTTYELDGNVVEFGLNSRRVEC